MGLIKKAWQHKEADSLYVEEVEVGEDAPRQVVSGLVKFIPEAQMQMRRCVLVCNLKPANMRGVKSHAMVLCATSLDGFQVCSHRTLHLFRPCRFSSTNKIMFTFVSKENR